MLLSFNLRNLSAGTEHNDIDLIFVSHSPDCYLNTRLLRCEVHRLQTNHPTNQPNYLTTYLPTAPFDAIRKKMSLYMDNYSLEISCIRSNPISMEDDIDNRPSSIRHYLKVLLWDM